MAATGRTIVFLSEWVGICHAVMNRIAPASPIVDLSHGIPPLDVRAPAAAAHLVAGAELTSLGDPVEPATRGIVDPRGWLSVVRGNPANAAEGLGSVAPGDPIWLTAGGR
jgi:hypothetical protein